MVEVSKIIGKVNPRHAENYSELLKKYKSPDKIPADEIKSKPISEHTLLYDSSSEQLEPIYFFILDLMNGFGVKSEKIVDNFTSSPGSGHFSEMGQKVTVMQQQATKVLGDVNTVLRSVLNILYDLRDFRTRLGHYDSLKSDNKDTQIAARLSLKQIWMDRVDINKGNASIKAMALGQGGFQTLLDAFLVIDNESLKGSDGKEIDLNERIKRILKPRIMEFNHWVTESERELRKRFEIEKTYLKSQVNSLKIYSRWAKPYLKAAQELEMKAGGERNPEIVKAFNTTILELTLLGTQGVKLDNGIKEGSIPKSAPKSKNLRDFFNCFVIEFTFRSIPQKVSQRGDYVFGGRTEVKFSSFVLNKEELDIVQKEIDKSDVADVMNLVEGMTTQSLEQLQEDIDEFLEEPEPEEKEVKKKSSGDNPFMAIIGVYNKKSEPKSNGKTEKKEQKKDSGEIKKDNFFEKNYIRPFAEKSAEDTVFQFFDIYKKAHGMPSYT